MAGGQAVAGDSWTVWGAGGNIGARVDQFHYISQTGGPTASITAQVLTQSRTSPWAKTGLMIRDSVASGAPYVAILVTPDRGIVVQYRPRLLARAHQEVRIPAARAPVYLRLTRYNGVSAAVSPDGQAWTTVADVRVPLDSAALLGVAITSHRPGTLSTATVRGVAVTP